MSRHRNRNNRGKGGNLKSQVSKWLKKVGNGVIQANLPSLASGTGIYLTFADQPFAMQLALASMENSLLIDSITGAVTPMAIELIKMLISKVKSSGVLA